MTKLSHQLFTQTEIHVDPAASQFRSRFWILPPATVVSDGSHLKQHNVSQAGGKIEFVDICQG